MHYNPFHFFIFLLNTDNNNGMKFNSHCYRTPWDFEYILPREVIFMHTNEKAVMPETIIADAAIFPFI